MRLDAPTDTANDAAGVSDAAGDESAKPAKKEKSKKKKQKRDADAEVDTIFFVDTVRPEEPSVSDQIIAEAQDAEASPVVKSKKDKKDKKDKKRKREANEDGAADTPAEAQDASASAEPTDVARDATDDQPQKKKKKKRAGKLNGDKRSGLPKKDWAKGRAKGEDGDSDAAAKSPAAKPAKEKKSKDKYNKNKDRNMARDSELADKWNVTALDGGAERQSKFMKLLGGGKASSSGAQNSGEARSKSDIQKSQDDLQKQYDAGMRMKLEGQGQRRGLGA